MLLSIRAKSRKFAYLVLLLDTGSFMLLHRLYFSNATAIVKSARVTLVQWYTLVRYNRIL